jgi:hypothetical protein
MTPIQKQHATPEHQQRDIISLSSNLTMAEESTPPSTPPPATPSASTTWKLPEGIEDHIESGMSRDLLLRNEKNIFLPF